MARRSHQSLLGSTLRNLGRSQDLPELEDVDLSSPWLTPEPVKSGDNQPSSSASSGTNVVEVIRETITTDSAVQLSRKLAKKVQGLDLEVFPARTLEPLDLLIAKEDALAA